MLKKVKKFAPVAAAVLALAAIFLLFAPVVAFEVGDEVVSYNGWQAIFGLSETKSGLGGEVTIEYLKFSFMNLLTLILLAVGIVLAVLSFLGKGNKFFAFIAVACFIVAGVFFFLTVAFTVAGGAYSTNILGQELSQAEAKKGWTLGAGAIIGGILSILAGLAAATPIALKLLKK